MAYDYERLISVQPLWWSDGRARHEAGSIILEDPAELDVPPADGRLAIAFAGIREPANAVQFASSYGLLTHSTTAHEPEAWDPEACKELREPFSVWLREATTVSGIIELSVALRAFERGDPHLLEASADTWIMLEEAAGVWIVNDPRGNGKRLRTPSVSRRARHVVSGLTARGLGGLHLGVGSRPGKRRHGDRPLFIGAIDPRTLKQMIYVDLWLLLTSPQEVRFCKQCGKAFIIHDRRQEYCTPACANRARYLRRKQQEIDSR